MGTLSKPFGLSFGSAVLTSLQKALLMSGLEFGVQFYKTCRARDSNCLLDQNLSVKAFSTAKFKVLCFENESDPYFGAVMKRKIGVTFVDLCVFYL